MTVEKLAVFYTDWPATPKGPMLREVFARSFM